MSNSKKTILVVDDEASLREAMETVLKEEGLNVLTAKNGMEAVQIATKGIPDLIILDIAMPDISGIEVARLLKEQEKTSAIPIIFLTNLSDAETISKVVKEGLFDYLVKTDWDIHALVAMIKKRLK